MDYRPSPLDAAPLLACDPARAASSEALADVGLAPENLQRATTRLPVYSITAK